MGGNQALREFSDQIGRSFGFSFVQLMPSGNTAFALLLQALHQETGKRQVVMPAYAHGSNAVILEALGLEPVLVDSSLDTFVQTHDRLREVCTKDTLCLVVHHTFGLAAYDASEVQALLALPCPIIEDCSQGLGSRWNRRPLGHVGRAAWTSFGRGENLSTYGGGAVMTNDAVLGHAIERLAGTLNPVSRAERWKAWGGMGGAALATRPWMYGMTWRAARRSWNPRIAEGYPRSSYAPIQAFVGRRLWNRMEVWSDQRLQQALRLARALGEVKGVAIPNFSSESEPAVNRFPVLIRHRGLRDQVQSALWRAGIEAATHYPQPLHRVMPMGYSREKDPFPTASYMTERLLTLPVHPGVSEPHLAKMVEVITKICG